MTMNVYGHVTLDGSARRSTSWGRSSRKRSYCVAVDAGSTPIREAPKLTREARKPRSTGDMTWAFASAPEGIRTPNLLIRSLSGVVSRRFVGPVSRSVTAVRQLAERTPSGPVAVRTAVILDPREGLQKARQQTRASGSRASAGAAVSRVGSGGVGSEGPSVAVGSQSGAPGSGGYAFRWSKTRRFCTTWVPKYPQLKSVTMTSPCSCLPFVNQSNSHVRIAPNRSAQNAACRRPRRVTSPVAYTSAVAWIRRSSWNAAGEPAGRLAKMAWSRSRIARTLAPDFLRAAVLTVIARSAPTMAARSAVTGSHVRRESPLARPFCLFGASTEWLGVTRSVHEEPGSPDAGPDLDSCQASLRGVCPQVFICSLRRASSVRTLDGSKVKTTVRAPSGEAAVLLLPAGAISEGR